MQWLRCIESVAQYDRVHSCSLYICAAPSLTALSHIDTELPAMASARSLDVDVKKAKGIFDHLKAHRDLFQTACDRVVMTDRLRILSNGRNFWESLTPDCFIYEKFSADLIDKVLKRREVLAERKVSDDKPHHLVLIWDLETAPSDFQQNQFHHASDCVTVIVIPGRLRFPHRWDEAETRMHQLAGRNQVQERLAKMFRVDDPEQVGIERTSGVDWSLYDPYSAAAYSQPTPLSILLPDLVNVLVYGDSLAESFANLSMDPSQGGREHKQKVKATLDVDVHVESKPGEGIERLTNGEFGLPYLLREDPTYNVIVLVVGHNDSELDKETLRIHLSALIKQCRPRTSPMVSSDARHVIVASLLPRSRLGFTPRSIMHLPRPKALRGAWNSRYFLEDGHLTERGQKIWRRALLKRLRRLYPPSKFARSERRPLLQLKRYDEDGRLMSDSEP